MTIWLNRKPIKYLNRTRVEQSNVILIEAQALTKSARNLQTTVKSSSQYPRQRVSLRKRQNKNRKSEDGAERENMPQKTSEADKP